MFFPFHIVLVLSNLASSLTTNQDFLRLEAVLKNEFTRNPKMIPAIVRSSFHDIMNFDGILGVGGPRGCILQQPMDQNKQLFGSMKNLQRLVSLHFENGSFTFADVISFAGKVAVEFAYDLGGEKVRWRPGRGECIHQEEALGMIL
jgi:catalase (peroxidase I)